jgi:lysophospholipase L1-like esterase
MKAGRREKGVLWSAPDYQLELTMGDEKVEKIDAGGPQPRGCEKGARTASWISNLALVLCSITVGVLLIEVGLRLFAPQPMSGTVFEYAPRGYSVLKSKGSALFSVGDRTGVYHFVSPHLRGQRVPPAGATRILVLGDSFTFGFGLSEEETYIAKLQQKIDPAFGINRIALLNAGIGGSGTSEHLAFLEDFGEEIAPRAVIVFVSIDDFNRAWRSPLYRLRNAESLDLDEGTIPISRFKKLANSEAYNLLIEHMHIVQLLRNAVIAMLFPMHSGVTQARDADEQSPTRDEISPDQQRLARALFRRIKAWCDARGIKLAVINNGWRSYDWLPKLLTTEHITAFDAAPVVQPAIARNSAGYTRERHPDPDGAELTADAVWPFVRNFIHDGLPSR